MTIDLSRIEKLAENWRDGIVCDDELGPETILALCKAVRAAMDILGHDWQGHGPNADRGCEKCTALSALHASLEPFGRE